MNPGLLQLNLLGGFALLRSSGEPITALPGRAPALLALLALDGGGSAGLSRERAAALLWCDASAERARQSLRQLLSDLRRLGVPVRADAHGIGWDLAAIRVDVHDFERGCGLSDPAQLAQALKCYRGPLAEIRAGAEGEFDAWRSAEQVRLHRRALQVCERLAQVLHAQGDEAQQAVVLQRWLELDPAAEPAHRALIRLWMRMGRCADALDQFERCRDALHAAHGVRPQAETMALHQELTRAALPSSPRLAALEALTVAVLPLSTLQRDAEILQPLADTLVEDFCAALARRPALTVVAAPMARAAAARAQGDLMRLGELLRARYLITGGLRSVAEGPARLSLNLVSGDDAVYLWAMQADVGAGDDRDEAAAAWAAEFELQVCLAASRAQTAGDEPAWALVRRALRTMFERGWSEESVRQSLEVYRDAIRADPAHALARAQKAILLALASNMGLNVGDAARAEALADAEQALELAPRNSEVLGYAGCALADLGEARRALPIVQRSIATNPGNPQAWAASGAAQLMLGRTEDGIAALERGLRLSPDDYRRPVWHTLLAGAHQRLGRLDRAAEHAQAACRADARYHPARLALAAVEIERGREAAARSALREALRIRPQMAPAEARGWVRKRWFPRLLALWPDPPPMTWP
jgi:DNA-binding SARP family transcriptional activator/thioredoxin-like negative regulator of GroEL